ncbi:NAD-dependent epimerase/dehydratase family protein [Ammoniphilus sp. YIM 78166]|uniref:NAD-dependent epimerase/dehydratase family protein n=1 Tax=Ammoniphilus sp. YIM 78166 TaxID=1644106 RepID=UPI001070500F|nr:NAD-dependent epimerase/dehydratase family protein [Ammoniphilus sp. YIM 78166]
MNVLVLGGTGVISRCIVNQLLEERHEVAIFNRKNKELSFWGEVEQYTGDKTNKEAFIAAMKKVKCDVVIDMISFNEEDARTTVQAFEGNVEQMIFTSSVAAYQRPYRTLPTIEEGEQLTNNSDFPYAFHKAEMERYLQKVIQTETVPITIIRPSLTYGVGAANVGVLRQNYGIVDRIRKGKPLVMFGDGTTPWSFTFAPDLAKGYAGIVGNRKTYGEAYHICSEHRQIWEDLYLEFGRLLGIEPKIVHLPSDLLIQAAPDLFNHIYYEKCYAGIFDNSKIKRDVEGLSLDMSLHQGLQMLLDWFEQEANTVDKEKDTLEDRLVDLHQRWSEQIWGVN